MVQVNKCENIIGQIELMTNPSHPSNGAATEVQASLSSLLASNSSLDPEELVRKLCSIINENYELKETITQNNLAIKHQLGLLERWGQQVDLQQKQYKQAIADSNKHLSTLQQENSLLRSALSSSKDVIDGGKFKVFDETIQSLNERIDVNETRLENVLSEKADLVNKKVQMEGDLSLMKCTLSSTQEELVHFQSQRANMLLTIKELRNALQKEKEHKKQDIPIQKQEVPVMLLQDHDDSDGDMKSALESEDIAQLALLQDLQVAKSQAECLESTLAEERLKISEERHTLARLHNENAKLKQDLLEAKQLSDRSEYTDHYYQAKIKSIHEQHDEATAKLVSYEELLGSKNEDIARLKKEMGQLKAQISEFKSERETIAVLRAQVEVYQADFRAEREARESLANEREKLRDEVRHLQSRNTQLVDELETYQRGHLTQGRTSRNGSVEPQSMFQPDQAIQDASWEKFSNILNKKEEEEQPPKNPEVPERDENLLYCPMCNKTFTELGPLEEHANRCIDDE